MCSEEDLASIARQLTGWEQVYIHLGITEPEAVIISSNHPGDYEAQKTEILKTWKTKKGEFQGTFKALSEVFLGLNNQHMVDVIRNVAAEAYRGLY